MELLSFWDLDLQSKLLEIDEHTESVQCVQFADKYSWMITSSRTELILWNVDIQENSKYNDGEANKENQGDSNKKKEQNRFIVQVK